MSTASSVRETRGLGGDDAWRTLATTGRLRLVGRAFRRLRAADGFSHARALAYAMSLVLVQGLIAFVGLAVAFGQGGLRRTIIEAVGRASPPPASGLLMWAVAQAQAVGREHRFLPLAVGLAGTLLTATQATGQIIRGANRLYGIEDDGPFVRKYVRAALLSLVVLGLLAAAGGVATVGHRLAAATGEDVHRAWRFLTWPVSLALAAAAFGGILRWGPRRRQPRWSWLLFGGAVGVAGWLGVTFALRAAFSATASFGEVYGPLAGIVALQLWTFCAAVATFFGAAVAAELEAVRSGTAPSPRSTD
jgi:uncharacterized BrkB/YihY/UPF0761 family membrane protein